VIASPLGRGGDTAALVPTAGILLRENDDAENGNIGLNHADGE
jgi:hypothetical protein